MRFQLELQEIIRIGETSSMLPLGQLGAAANGRSGLLSRGLQALNAVNSVVRTVREQRQRLVNLAHTIEGIPFAAQGALAELAPDLAAELSRQGVRLPPINVPDPLQLGI